MADGFKTFDLISSFLKQYEVALEDKSLTKEDLNLLGQGLEQDIVVSLAELAENHYGQGAQQAMSKVTQTFKAVKLLKDVLAKGGGEDMAGLLKGLGGGLGGLMDGIDVKVVNNADLGTSAAATDKYETSPQSENDLMEQTLNRMGITMPGGQVPKKENLN